MSSVLNKLKGAAQGSTGKLAQGSKLPAGHALKENDPHTGTVSLDKLAGKSECPSRGLLHRLRSLPCPLLPPVLVVGVPGAFTPPCSSHVPGYVTDVEKFAAKGVKGIYIVAVNDAFTTQAWKEKLGASAPNVHFLADDDGAVSAVAAIEGNGC